MTSPYNADRSSNLSSVSLPISVAPSYHTTTGESSTTKHGTMDQEGTNSATPTSFPDDKKVPIRDEKCAPSFPQYPNNDPEPGPLPPPIIYERLVRREGVSYFTFFAVVLALVLSLTLNGVYTTIALKGAIWPSRFREAPNGGLNIAPVINIHGADVPTASNVTVTQIITATSVSTTAQSTSLPTVTQTTTVIQPIVEQTTLSTTTASPSLPKVTITTSVPAPTTTEKFQTPESAVSPSSSQGGSITNAASLMASQESQAAQASSSRLFGEIVSAAISLKESQELSAMLSPSSTSSPPTSPTTPPSTTQHTTISSTQIKSTSTGIPLIAPQGLVIGSTGSLIVGRCTTETIMHPGGRLAELGGHKTVTTKCF
ncbi:hypothetical protein NA57DRAFT_52795 [Rhizodiscina lignyota]|uniref:Uncharacterized protein n=1 Tax=Rhizodiscina lignyota TaxID=1504668 RepID=A0A9P4IPZ8_9PEZI|nr:hypothetical protein NA57DRAFT_52795 [Rhizodiscina lignyota]